jgi:CDP-paratose 2-epimerase
MSLAFRKLLITGGAGFVGANLAVLFRRDYPDLAVAAFDNLKRRGSELNLARLREAGVHFIHGDIRCREDIESWPDFDLLIDCSAEPSVQAGLQGSPLPVLQHNLTGSLYCAEAARQRNAGFLFLSTSRIYPMDAINRLPYREDGTRFRWALDDSVRGISPRGISEDFPLEGVRSLYGATKLSAELILQEFAYSYRLPVLINRCGVLAGPWQMGKVDQGVITLWVARHLFGQALRYIGFGGQGKQVRDVLHVEDLYQLLVSQMQQTSHWDGRVYNVGGGERVSSSLCELTSVCQMVTEASVPIQPQPETSPVDIRIYLTDSSKVETAFGWRPQKSVSDIVTDICSWLRHHQEQLRPVFS